MKDRLLAIVVMAGALAYLYADTQLPVLITSDPLGTKLFPALVGVGMLLSGMLLFVSSIRKVSKTNSEAASDNTEASFSPQQHYQHRMVIGGVAAWTWRSHE